MMTGWRRAIEKKEIDENAATVIQFIKEIVRKEEVKFEYIAQLEEQLKENKTEKEKELEREIEELKEKLNQYESSEFLYGFAPKEREVVHKWHIKHFNSHNLLNPDGSMIKSPSHGHITYSIDIHPETLIKSVKCSTCGTQLVIYDDINDLWEYSENGKKRKIKKEDLEEGGQE